MFLEHENFVWTALWALTYLSKLIKLYSYNCWIVLYPPRADENNSSVNTRPSTAAVSQQDRPAGLGGAVPLPAPNVSLSLPAHILGITITPRPES